MMRGLEIGRIQVASRALGVGRAALEALGLALLVAASAHVVDLTARVATALSWGTGLLVACLLVVMAVILPARRAQTPVALARECEA